MPEVDYPRGNTLPVVTDFNASVIDEFRANEGKVGGQLAGSPLVLVTHRGARTGVERTTPLGYFDDGDQLLLFASMMGAPKHPQWYFNLRANPDVTVERGTDRYPARAVVLTGDERAAAWQRVLTSFPFLAEHQQRAGSREIPVVALRPLS